MISDIFKRPLSSRAGLLVLACAAFVAADKQIDVERYQDLLGLANSGDKVTSLVVSLKDTNNSTGDAVVLKNFTFESVLKLEPFTLEPNTNTTAEKNALRVLSNDDLNFTSGTISDFDISNDTIILTIVR